MLRKWFGRSDGRPPHIASKPVSARRPSAAHAEAEAESRAQWQRAEDWRKDFYDSNRALIGELDRVALRVIEAAEPDPAADAAAPEVSILMPVWNRADMVATAVKSVLAQSFRGWELIVIDDGSTDDLAGALRPFTIDRRIRVVRQTNMGECAARNSGLRLARGELIAYLDSDNFWYPNFLDAAVRVFRDDRALEIAYAGISYEWPNGDVRFYLLPYSREALLRDNLADMNVIVHRRRAYERFGGFDEALNRALEWDLMLRYTVDYPAAHIPVVGARYRIVDRNYRLSGRHALYDSVFRVRSKWWPRPATSPRILYALPARAALRDSAAATEIACMRRFGAAIAAWAPGAEAVAAGVPHHAGSLAHAVRTFCPDIVHVHGIDAIGELGSALADTGLPLTLRADRGAFDARALEAGLKLPNLHRAYLAAGGPPANDTRIAFLAPYFDTRAFAPSARKDPRLVVAAAPGGTAGERRALLDLAALLPEHRVVVVAERAPDDEAFAALAAYRAKSGSPAELVPEPPRAEMAALLGEAGIVVHGAGALRGEAQADALYAIVEALATGAHVLAPKLPVYERVIGNSGAFYDGVAEAAALVRARAAWLGAEWNAARIRSIDRAYRHHADELVLRPLFEDWCALAREWGAPALAAAAD